MVNFFWMPVQVWYYVVIPIIVILLIYAMFSLIYGRKKDSIYYNYVVDYVYSTLGIIFCSLLFCLLLGYSMATIKTILSNNLLESYKILSIVLVILPLIPTCFLIYLIRLFVKNLKRKEQIDNELNNLDLGSASNTSQENETFQEPTLKRLEESEFELKKKNS